MKFDELCDDVFEIDDIQSISIINKMGRAVEKKSRNGIEIVDRKRNEMLLMQSVLVMSMGKDLDEDFGKIGYIQTQREHMSMLLFPLDGHAVLITSKTAIGLRRLLKRLAILNMVASPGLPHRIKSPMPQNTIVEIMIPTV